MSLPQDAAKRKSIPLATGCIDYFPDALAAVADLSRVGGAQHNPGQPLFWDKTKSTDHGDALMRHFLERGTFDSDGVRHSAKVAWRALALLQVEIEREQEASKTAHGFATMTVVGEDGTVNQYVFETTCTRHPMAAESLREEFTKADGETGV